MIKLIVLILATVLDILVLWGLHGGKKYAQLVQSMTGTPLQELLSVGFVVGDMKIFSFKDKFLSKFAVQTKLIYGEKYAKYYAYTLFAQALTYILLIMSAVLTLSVLFDTAFMVFLIVLGVIASAVVWNFCILAVGDKVKERRTVCLTELPDMVIRFALLVNSGMVLREAWRVVAETKDNALYKLMRDACEDMRNGMSETAAIYAFGIKTDCQEIRKFTSSLVQGIEKGNDELSLFLISQSQEMLTHKRQMLLQKGEKAAGKLILPIGITFIGVILIIAVSALQSFSF